MRIGRFMVVLSIYLFVRSNVSLRVRTKCAKSNDKEMKKLFFFIILSMELGLISCKDESPNPGFFAGGAAKGYYDLLLEGKYEAYVAGFNQPNRLPDSYHKQLVLNAQMFVEQQNEERKGIKSVEVLNAKSDTTLHIADVFLQVAYGDKTKEQIVVPMVEVDGEWKMR